VTDRLHPLAVAIVASVDDPSGLSTLFHPRQRASSAAISPSDRFHPHRRYIAANLRSSTAVTSVKKRARARQDNIAGLDRRAITTAGVPTLAKATLSGVKEAVGSGESCCGRSAGVEGGVLTNSYVAITISRK